VEENKTEEKSEDKPAENDDSKDKEKPEETSPAATPTLAQQSKIRSTSFRAGSISVAPPGPFSPDGDTAPDIYRKQVTRIEELEKETKRLAKESSDSEKRWKKAEEELADLREGDSSNASAKQDGQTEKLVRAPCALKNVLNANSSAESRDCITTTPKDPAPAAGVAEFQSWSSTVGFHGITAS
jgi:hypothetical protein